MMIFRYNITEILVLIMLVFIKPAYSQSCCDSMDLHNPVDKPLYLSGNFCEPRYGHFHIGVDFKTDGKVGKSLYLIDDAVLHRIKISENLYGRAVYFLHKDSIVSLYGHVSEFVDTIEELCREIQYRNESFVIDTVFSNSEINFKKGDIIGYSGNEGFSHAPHLHFELRDLKTGYFINPQKCWDFKDNMAPEINSVVFYDVDAPDKSEKSYSFFKENKNIAGKTLDIDSGKWGIGVEVIDRMNDTRNRYGVDELILYIDDKKIYHSKIENFKYKYYPLNEAWFDRYYLEEYSKYVQKCFITYANKTNMVNRSIGDGYFNIYPEEIKNVLIKAIDFQGNVSKLSFKIKGIEDKNIIIDDKSFFDDAKDIILPGVGYYLKVPAGSLSRDANLQIETVKNKKGDIIGWNFNDHDISFVRPFYLSLDGSNIKPKDKERTVVLRKRRGSVKCLTGKWESIYFTVKSDEAGYYSFDIDDKAPVLYDSNISDSVNLKNQPSIFYKVADNLSGISEYNAYVDDNWVLLSYDPKNKLLQYKFDDRINKNYWHKFKILVEDAVGNVTKEEKVFYY